MDLVIRRELWGLGGGDLGNSWSREKWRKDGENEGQEEEGGKGGNFSFGELARQREGFFSLSTLPTGLHVRKQP